MRTAHGLRLSVGEDPQDVTARRQRKEAELNALNQCVTVVPENGDSGHGSVATAVAQFLEETELTKKPKTPAAYTTALNYFTKSCRLDFGCDWTMVKLEDLCLPNSR